MKYKRVLLKLSGESLGGDSGTGFDTNVLAKYAKELSSAVANGVQFGIVIGGGNIFRGVAGVGKGFSRVKGDQMGMLATVINSIALSMFLKSEGVKAEVFTSVLMEPMARYYAKEKAIEFMENGGIAIIAGGTGNPYFTTDSASALRACEIEAEVLLKGTHIDGVYTSDPKKDKNATRYDFVTFDEAIGKNLRVMDQTAFALCKENDMPIIVFDMDKEGSLTNVLEGLSGIGTLVANKKP